MIALLDWLSPAAVSAIGWALVHSLWQGALVAGVASLAVRGLESASARYFVALLALGLVVAAPIVTVFVVWEPGVETWAPTLAEDAYPRFAGVAAGTDRAAHGTVRWLASPRAFAWLVTIWLLGVAGASSRVVGGLWFLERLRRLESTPVAGRLLEVCEAMRKHLRIRRRVQFRESNRLAAPAVVGWLRPIVFLPVSALTGLSDQQLRLVIAHELAHVRRWDTFVNLLQTAAETLLFYHPAVWWLNRTIRAEREHCCDDTALAVCPERVEYARALAFLAGLRAAPELAMAVHRGPLAARVARILGASPRGGQGAGWGFVCLVSALLAGHVLAQAHSGSRNDRIEKVSAETGEVVVSGGSGTAVPAASALTYAAALERVGLSPTVQQLVALDNLGVTAEYVEVVSDVLDDLDANKVIALRAQHIESAWLQDLRAAGLRFSAEQALAMKIHGVSPAFVDGLRDLGLVVDADRLVSFRVHGVSPKIVRELRALGLGGDGETMIRARVHGVSPTYAAGILDAGLRLDIDDLVRLRVHGVSAGHVRRFLDARTEPATVTRLIALRQKGQLDAHAAAGRARTRPG